MRCRDSRKISNTQHCVLVVMVIKSHLYDNGLFFHHSLYSLSLLSTPTLQQRTHTTSMGCTRASFRVLPQQHCSYGEEESR
jgi:hypothetical protein